MGKSVAKSTTKVGDVVSRGVSMEIPKNCWQCHYTAVCPAAHYGGSLCKYAEEICGKTIETTLSQGPAEGRIPELDSPQEK